MSLKHLADELAARGRYGDTELVHMTKGEVAGLQSLAQAAGGSLTVNPDTGKPEAFFLAALLPTILGGVGASLGLGTLGTAALGAGVGALTNKKNPLMGAVMGGFGGVGGGQFANALSNAGTTTAQLATQPVAEAAGKAATDQALKDFAMRQTMAEGAQLSGAEAAQAAMQGIRPSPIDLTAPNLDAIRNQAMGDAYMAATPKPGFDAMQAGIRSLGQQEGRDAALRTLGGASGAFKSAGYAAAPAMYGYMTQPMESEDRERPEMPEYEYTAGLTGDYYGTDGDFSTRQRNYFTDPTFTRRAASGGIMRLNEGGKTGNAPLAAKRARFDDLVSRVQGRMRNRTTAQPTAPVQSPPPVQSTAPIQSAPPVQPSAPAPSGIAAIAPAPVANPSQGMTGASADAMRYLMGEAPTPRAAVSRATSTTTVAAPKADSRNPYMYDAKTHSVVKNPGYVAPVEKAVDPALLEAAGLADARNQFGYAEGGLASLARGGMKAGGFVIPADITSFVGEGNTEAGYERIARALPGAVAIRGKDGGQADTVKTSIEGKQPARVAHGEMYVPPEAVKRAGGAKKLYAMMKNVRQQATGRKAQVKPVDLKKALA